MVNSPGINDIDGPIRFGISACLLGERVRFDGGNKHDRFVIGVLGHQFQLVPFCPEVAIGLGTPREPIRRVGDASHGLCGYILKKDSPSCGMERVRVYTDKGMPGGKGRGLFADELMRVDPMLPVEEEGRLRDPVLHENFISRVFVLARWHSLQRRGLTAGGLIDFHARHKFLQLAHKPAVCRDLGRLLGNLRVTAIEEIAAQHIGRLIAALSTRSDRQRHVNVLQYLAGFLKRDIDNADRAELADSIATYWRGEHPLIVPLQLLRHRFRRNPNDYISRQACLDPYPRALILRNAL